MMKRLLYVLTITMILLFISGCAKDEITPSANPNHEKTTTEEVDAKDKEKQPDEKNRDDRSDKQEKETDTDHSDQQTETNQTDKMNKKDEKKSNATNKRSDDYGEAEHQSGSSNKTYSSSGETQKTPQRNSGSQSNQTSEKSTNTKKDTSKPSQPKSVEKEKKPDKKPGKTAKKEKEKTKEEPKKSNETVTVSITTGDVKGTILAATKVTYQDGDAALDPTLRILKEKGIQYSVRGSKASAYVEGIDNLYEFDEGQNSGWLIKVDGVLIDRSAGIYPVKDGSTIEWIYTTDYIKYPEGGS